MTTHIDLSHAEAGGLFRNREQKQIDNAKSPSSSSLLPTGVSPHVRWKCESFGELQELAAGGGEKHQRSHDWLQLDCFPSSKGWLQCSAPRASHVTERLKGHWLAGLATNFFHAIQPSQQRKLVEGKTRSSCLKSLPSSCSTKKNCFRKHGC